MVGIHFCTFKIQRTVRIALIPDYATCKRYWINMITAQSKGLGDVHGTTACKTRQELILFLCFLANQRFIFVIFSSVATHRGQPVAKCHPRWQPTRRSPVSCGLGRRWIRTRDCRTTVWQATNEPPRLPDRNSGWFSAHFWLSGKYDRLSFLLYCFTFFDFLFCNTTPI